MKLTTKASNQHLVLKSLRADNTQPLNQEQASTFRTCVGILLHIGQDRPDMQFAVRGLASKMWEPTHSAYKHLVHLVQYMAKTEGYHLVYRKTPRGLAIFTSRLRTVVTIFIHTSQGTSPLRGLLRLELGGRKDTRRSTSSETIFLDGQCIYSFSRNQKSGQPKQW